MKPVLIYDGDCGFCRHWIARWRSWTGERVEYAPYQEAASRYPKISEAEFKASAQLVEPGGEVYRGAEAVFRALAYAPGKGLWLRLYRGLPGFSTLSEAAYRFVAGRRRLFSLWTR